MPLIKNNVVVSTYLYRTELKNFQGDIKKEDKLKNIQLQKRIKKGFDAPVYVWYDNENYILDGHQRLIALNFLANEGFLLEDDKVPVVYIKANTLEEAKEKVLEYNSKYAEFDLDKLSEWSKGLDLDGIEIDGLEFGEEKEDKEEIEDILPEICFDVPSIVQKGDIFQLGGHRLMCGDSTDFEDVKILMNGQKASMIWTDPPYNVDYKGHADNTRKGILNDKMDSNQFYSFLKNAFQNFIDFSNKGAGIYVWHNHKYQAVFQKALEDNNIEIKQQIIWNKPSLGLGGGDYRPKHELCFYCAKEGDKNIFYGDRTNSTVIDTFINKSDIQILNIIKKCIEAETEGKTTIFSVRRDNVNEYIHPTQKPVELCEVSIENNSIPGNVVLDLFEGSGTCLITCEKKERIHYGMELDPKHIELIIKRYFEYTNGEKEIKCLSRDLDILQIIAGRSLCICQNI